MKHIVIIGKNMNGQIVLVDRQNYFRMSQNAPEGVCMYIYFNPGNGIIGRSVFIGDQPAK